MDGPTSPTEYFLGDYTEVLTSWTGPGKVHTEDRRFNSQVRKSDAQIKSNHRKKEYRFFKIIFFKDIQSLLPRI